jgi:hypothetical protein
VTPTMERAVLASLAKEPQARPASAGEFLRLVEAG